MLIAHATLHFLLPWLLLLHQATATTDCVGDTLNYTGSGIFVPFKNLCGQDINATVDGLGLHVRNRTACLIKCVSWSSLCYGFDFNELSKENENNCFLMKGEFGEGDALPQVGSNAGMVLPDFVTNYRQTCAASGLSDCLQKQLVPISSAAAAASTSPVLILSTSSVSPSSTSPPLNSSPLPAPSGNNGLSIGAKAGIGAAFGAVVLFGSIAVLSVLRSQRKRNKGTKDVGQVDQPGTLATYSDGNAIAEKKHRATHELGADGTHELGADGTHELGADGTQEMESTDWMDRRRMMTESQ